MDNCQGSREREVFGMTGVLHGVHGREKYGPQAKFLRTQLRKVSCNQYSEGVCFVGYVGAGRDGIK
eukprot:2703708-Pyramimonas_sp.AAC.1